VRPLQSAARERRVFLRLIPGCVGIVRMEVLRNYTTRAYARFTQMERISGRGYGLRASGTGRAWMLESSRAGLRGGARSWVITHRFHWARIPWWRRGRERPGTRAVLGSAQIRGHPAATPRTFNRVIQARKSLSSCGLSVP
jgi:hypothetical protein